MLDLLKLFDNFFYKKILLIYQLFIINHNFIITDLVFFKESIVFISLQM